MKGRRKEIIDEFEFWKIKLTNLIVCLKKKQNSPLNKIESEITQLSQK